MILAVLQARMSSRRLPGKALADVEGRPMILRQIERLARARRIDRLVVATSDDPSDDPLAAILADAGRPAFRGPLADVLARFAAAMRAEGATGEGDRVVRLTADCPLADGGVVDAAVALAEATGAAYASNAERRSYPDGLDVEVVAASALLAADREATAASDREHVTPYVRARPERFAPAHLVHDTDLSRHRWTVDRAEDLAFVRAVYAALHPHRPAFTWGDVLALLAARPDLAALEPSAPDV